MIQLNIRDTCINNDNTTAMHYYYESKENPKPIKTAHDNQNLIRTSYHLLLLNGQRGVRPSNIFIGSVFGIQKQKYV